MVGPGCNKRSVVLGFTEIMNFHKKTGPVFRGVRALVPVPSKGRSGLEETPGYLGGRLRTHTGHGTSQFVAVNVMGPGKTQKTAQILPHSMIILMLSVRVMANLVVRADSLCNSGIKTSMFVPK